MTREWTVLGATAPGTEHERKGLPNQDAYRYTQKNGVTILVVADGAGSASQARTGARISANAMVTTLACVAAHRGAGALSPGAWKFVLACAVKDARIALENHVREPKNGITFCRCNRHSRQPRSLAEHAATLAACVITPRAIAYAQIGDPAIILGYKDGSYRQATTQDRGRYANTTWFLTSPDYLEHVQVGAEEATPIQAAILLTDGLADRATTKDGPYAPFCKPLIEGASAADTLPMAKRKMLRHWLRSTKARSATSDDRTLLLACRRNDDD